jgi:UDP-glucose 4-epimerase
VNAAFGSRTSLNEYIHVLGEVVGRRLAVEHTEPRPGDVRDSQADTGRIRQLFPGVAPVALREGLEHTVTWYRSYLGQSRSES